MPLPPALAVLGTASDVGKTVLVAGLGRILCRRGVRVAPFKAQNMALNSYVTDDGREVGRAQAMQAEACGVPVSVDMNPILLKPESDGVAQVVVHGRPLARRTARAYLEGTRTLFPYVEESYRRLARAHDVVLIEGAGSAAEVNLRSSDIVNWRTAEMADARVALVADIDRGGVFAQVLGTLDLIRPEERERVVAIVVNRFRGDRSLFDDGARFLERRSGLPVVGVVPWLRDLDLEQEDALPAGARDARPLEPHRVNLAVVLVQRMSNFTDFRALAAEPDVALRYVARPEELDGADAVFLPGSKSTADDLADLKRRGFDAALRGRRPYELVGLCGGYQMLGRSVVEHGDGGTVRREDGFALLDVDTEIHPGKTTVRVEGSSLVPGCEGERVRGYEIHAGETRRGDAPPCFRIRRAGAEDVLEDGARDDRARVLGTYLHGVFDSPRFRRRWLNRLRARKGLPALDDAVSEEVGRRLSGALDRLADHLERHLEPGFVDGLTHPG